MDGTSCEGKKEKPKKKAKKSKMLFCVCTDVDECANTDSNSCDQVCTNTEGGFECSCTGDFVLAADRITCSSECGYEVTFPEFTESLFSLIV